MLVVAEATVAEEMVNLVWREVLERVGPVGGIATSYVWGRRISVVAEEKECVAVDSSSLDLGTTA